MRSGRRRSRHGCHLDREANSRARRNRRRSEIEKGQPMSVTRRSRRAELASEPRRCSVLQEYEKNQPRPSFWDRTRPEV